MAKYLEYSLLLENRIRSGDYALREFPTEHELAREIGASRKTARRAIQELIRKQILVRRPYCRPIVNVDGKLTGRLQLAFLAPAFYSQGIENWRFAVERAANEIGAAVRPVDYVHWDDPVIPETLDHFDGVFLFPSSETIPPSLLRRFAAATRLVSLEADLSSFDVPSIQLLPPRFIHLLGDHLYALGHREIDCLNTQPMDRVITLRLSQWLLWQKMHGIAGRVIDEPVAPYEHAAPKAYQTMKRILKRKEFTATALVCLTDAAAIGANRALHEHGLKIGREVSVTAMEGGWDARLYCPSRTSLQPPDADVYLKLCMDWFAKRSDSWIGPLLVEPSTLEVFHGESTGPAPE